MACAGPPHCCQRITLEPAVFSVNLKMARYRFIRHQLGSMATGKSTEKFSPARQAGLKGAPLTASGTPTEQQRDQGCRPSRQATPPRRPRPHPERHRPQPAPTRLVTIRFPAHGAWLGPLTTRTRSGSFNRTGFFLFRGYFRSWRAMTMRWIWLVPS